MKIGIIGCGFVGGALKRWLEEHNPSCKLLVSDPAKGFNDDLTDADVFFISIHIPTEDDLFQNIDLLKQIIRNLPDKPIFIRTTLLPHACDNLSKEFNRKIYFMPEFLTERTAYEDVCSQPMVFTGEVELLEKIFVGKEFIVMTSLEAEIAKYAHNVFGALKVTYFNGIYKLSEKNSCDYENIRKGLLLSGYINPMHTAVPGPDGKFGFGGKCFPKDIKAFQKYNQKNAIGDMLNLVLNQNQCYRGNDE